MIIPKPYQRPWFSELVQRRDAGELTITLCNVEPHQGNPFKAIAVRATVNPVATLYVGSDPRVLGIPNISDFKNSQDSNCAALWLCPPPTLSEDLLPFAEELKADDELPWRTDWDPRFFPLNATPTMATFLGQLGSILRLLKEAGAEATTPCYEQLRIADGEKTIARSWHDDMALIPVESERWRRVIIKTFVGPATEYGLNQLPNIAVSAPTGAVAGQLAGSIYSHNYTKHGIVHRAPSSDGIRCAGIAETFSTSVTAPSWRITPCTPV